MVNEEIGSVLIFLQSLKTQKENRLKRYHPTRHLSRQNRNKRVKQNKYTIKQMNRKKMRFFLCYDAQLEKEMHNVPKIILIQFAKIKSRCYVINGRAVFQLLGIPCGVAVSTIFLYFPTSSGKS